MTEYFLDRFKFLEDGTFGSICDKDSNQLCFTVERPITGDHPCIAPGTYTFNRFKSPTKGDVWLRDDKAADDGRSMIEIHAANMASQLLGCIAVGDAIGQINGVDAVLNSKSTLVMLHSILPDSFQLTITGEPT